MEENVKVPEMPTLRNTLQSRSPRPLGNSNVIWEEQWPLMITRRHWSLNEFITLSTGIGSKIVWVLWVRVGARESLWWCSALRLGMGMEQESWTPVLGPYSTPAQQLSSEARLHETESPWMQTQREMICRKEREEVQWGKELGQCVWKAFPLMPSWQLFLVTFCGNINLDAFLNEIFRFILRHSLIYNWLSL